MKDVKPSVQLTESSRSDKETKMAAYGENHRVARTKKAKMAATAPHGSNEEARTQINVDFRAQLARSQKV